MQRYKELKKGKEKELDEVKKELDKVKNENQLLWNMHTHLATEIGETISSAVKKFIIKNVLQLENDHIVELSNESKSNTIKAIDDAEKEAETHIDSEERGIATIGPTMKKMKR